MRAYSAPDFERSPEGSSWLNKTLDAPGVELLEMAITKLGLSARAYDRILKVSRTIADMVDPTEIRPEHISEAIQYRNLDRNLMA